MIIKLFMAAVLGLFACHADAESLSVDPKHAAFDVATAFSTVRQTYTVTNHGAKPVTLLRWKAIAGYGDVTHLPKKLQPGESGTFEVVLPLPGKLGSTLHRFALFTDEPGVERYRFTLSGFVVSLISPPRGLLDFGTVDADASSEQQRQVTLSAQEKNPLILTKVISAPSWLDARISGSTITGRIREHTTLGVQAGIVKLATNLEQQPFVEVVAKAIVQGKLKPSVYAIALKPVEIGSRASADIELNYSGKSDLSTLKMDAPEGWTTRKSRCESAPAAPGKCVRINLSKRIVETGRFTGALQFHLGDEPVLSIPFGAVGLGKDQTIHELVVDERKELDNQDYADIGKALKTEFATDAKDANSKAANSLSAPGDKIAHSEGRGPVRLHWRAGHDDTVFGYVVYRATDRAGPFVRMGDKPIRHHPAENAVRAPSEYEFIDPEVAVGSTYYYYIDVITADGTQQRFSPVLSKEVIP